MRKKRIAVIGGGTAGLHLIYVLHKSQQFDITLFANRTPDEVKDGKVTSTQVHFHDTRMREGRYNMPAWEDAPTISCIHVTVGGQKLFVGQLKETAKSVDQRQYFFQYMKEIANRGVAIQYGKVTEDKVRNLAEDFDLLVDCSGKVGPILPFPREESFPVIPKHLRKCSLGYFYGVKSLEPGGIGINVLPALGELIEIPALTERGKVNILFIEAVPGSELDAFKGIKTGAEFAETMKLVTKKFFPSVYQRIEQEKFGICDEKGYLQIAVKPKVCRPYYVVNGKLFLGCGDSVILNDPITGQGANTASYCAEQLYLTLVEEMQAAWDEKLGQKYWQRIQPHVRQVTEWTNAMMAPLPEHVVKILMNCAKYQAKADEFASWFENPSRAHQSFFKSPIEGVNEERFAPCQLVT
jgi:hypothetical protein